MEVPRLGVKLELQLPVNATTMATRILKPLSQAKAQTHILMETSQILNLLSHNGNPWDRFLKEQNVAIS